MQARRAHHAAVHPADRQHGRIAQGCRADGASTWHAASGMAGQKRNKVFHHTHRADTGAATAVGDAEGLVQVQVAHVAAKLTRGGGADQRVHVGTVYINTAAVLVHQRAQLFDRCFKHAVCAGVGDHYAG